MRKKRRYKKRLMFLAVIITSVLALYKPEYVESTARAFLLLIGVL